MTLFLSSDELESLTGYELPGWQKRWLDSHGYRYEKTASGRPVVLRSYVESKLSGIVVANDAKMNLDAIRKRA